MLNVYISTIGMCTITYYDNAVYAHTNTLSYYTRHHRKRNVNEVRRSFGTIIVWNFRIRVFVFIVCILFRRVDLLAVLNNG